MFWTWKIDGTKNQYGSGGSPRGFEMEGSVPGDTQQAALESLAGMDLRWDLLDPDEEFTVTFTPGVPARNLVEEAQAAGLRVVGEPTEEAAPEGGVVVAHGLDDPKLTRIEDVERIPSGPKHTILTPMPEGQ